MQALSVLIQSQLQRAEVYSNGPEIPSFQLFQTAPQLLNWATLAQTIATQFRALQLDSLTQSQKKSVNQRSERFLVLVNDIANLAEDELIDSSLYYVPSMVRLVVPAPPSSHLFCEGLLIQLVFDPGSICIQQWLFHGLNIILVFDAGSSSISVINLFLLVPSAEHAATKSLILFLLCPKASPLPNGIVFLHAIESWFPSDFYQ